MPTEQPSNAPQADAPEPTDDLNVAAVLADDGLDRTPGGGGLGGSKAADAQAGTAGGQGGTAPNMAGDTGLGVSGDAEAEARAQAAETMPSTGGRSTGG